MKQVILLCFLSLLLLYCLDAKGGVRNPNQDAEAIARGNAFTATADNPSAIYYNPAGITQLEGQNLELGSLFYLDFSTQYKSTEGNQAHSAHQVSASPQAYYTYSLTNIPLSFGVGLYSPFGLSMLWPDNSGFRSLAIEADLLYSTLNPVVAYKMGSLSLAVGPSLNYSQIKITRGLAAPNDMLEFFGDGFSYGFNAGALWQPVRQWSLGANYRSSSTMDYSGHSTYNYPIPIPAARTPTTASFEFPQTVSGGISYRPTEKWNLEFDIDWTDWNSVRTLTLNGTKNIPGIGTDLQFPLNWHGSWFYEAGVSRYFTNGWFVSAGYFYSTESNPDKFYTPLDPDTDLHAGCLGFGQKGEHWRWAVTGQIITGPARTVSGSQPNPVTGQSADGSYRLGPPLVCIFSRVSFLSAVCGKIFVHLFSFLRRLCIFAATIPSASSAASC